MQTPKTSLNKYNELHIGQNTDFSGLGERQHALAGLGSRVGLPSKKLSAIGVFTLRTVMRPQCRRQPNRRIDNEQYC